MLGEAIADFDAAIQYQPNSPYALDGRGWALNLKGEYAKALADLDRAIAAKPTYWYAYNNRGWSHNGLGQYEKALVDLTESIRLRPSFEYAYGNRAFAYRQLRRFPQAAADVSELIRRHPDSAGYYNDRASIYIAGGNYRGALADLKSALKLTEDRFERQSLEAAIAETQRLLEDGAPHEPSKPQLDKDGGQRIEGQPPSGGRRVALVIGNTHYQNFGFPVLDNPGRDADAVAAALRRAGFSEVIVRYNLDFRATQDALAKFETLAQNADWAMIYYAGHGVEVSGVNYLVPIDAAFKHPEDVGLEAVPLALLMRSVRGAKLARLVVLDACRNNPLIDDMARTIGGIRNGLADVDPPGDIYVVYSVRRGLTAQDGPPGKNSPFAESLRHLDEPGLALISLFRKVRDDVKGKTNGNQVPFPYGWPPEVSFHPI